MKEFFLKLFYASVIIAIILGITKSFLDSSNFYSIIIYFHLAMYAFIIIASLSLIISVILAIFSKNR